jgi:ABC-type lipoprotein release transport system permease subunit
MVDVPQLLGIALTVIGPFLLVSVVPAWRAAMADPMEVMRGA